ncbi:McrC family protein [Rhodococcus opacus]|uniref:McrC family protein n=1 Tax=Rhodococcus opacus TaxID=37919 RepID=UPI001C468D98|nr:McrC family protein [Rhodococcus opacus]
MSTLIETEEHRTASVPDEIAAGVPTEFWAAADCTLSRSVRDIDWTLRAGNSVGIARIATPTTEVTLHIRPKLPQADVFFMADYAYAQRHEPLRILDFDDAMLDALSKDPTACLLMWHARAVDRFASRWLRRGYDSRVRLLESKVRGKIIVGQYLRNHLATGDAARIPCKVLERTQDTPNNRLLKAGLRQCAALSHTLPVPEARRAVLRQVNATLPRFSQVSDITATPADIRAASTRGPQRHYRQVLHSTVNLLANSFVGDSVGTYATQSFMWQMPTLFQESVRGLVDALDNLTLDNSGPGKATVHSSDGLRRITSKVDPDLVLHTAEGHTILLDTKYKHALPRTDDTGETVLLGPRQRIKVSRPDVYQAVAYRQHDHWTGALTGLLYPVSLAPGEALPQPMEVRGFGEVVNLLFIDIGPAARRNLQQFRASLHKLIRNHYKLKPTEVAQA